MSKDCWAEGDCRPSQMLEKYDGKERGGDPGNPNLVPMSIASPREHRKATGRKNGNKSPVTQRKTLEAEFSPEAQKGRAPEELKPKGEPILEQRGKKVRSEVRKPNPTAGGLTSGGVSAMAAAPPNG